MTNSYNLMKSLRLQQMSGKYKQDTQSQIYMLQKDKKWLTDKAGKHSVAKKCQLKIRFQRIP